MREAQLCGHWASLYVGVIEVGIVSSVQVSQKRLRSDIGWAWVSHHPNRTAHSVHTSSIYPTSLEFKFFIVLFPPPRARGYHPVPNTQYLIVSIYYYTEKTAA